MISNCHRHNYSVFASIYKLCPSPSPKLGKMPIRVDFLAFDLFVLYYRSPCTMSKNTGQEGDCKFNSITSLWLLPIQVHMAFVLCRSCISLGWQHSIRIRRIQACNERKECVYLRKTVV